MNFYEPFLDITIDNSVKKDAWLKLVEYLDDLNEIDETHPLIMGMNNIDISKMDIQTVKNNAINLLSGEPSFRENYINDIISFVKSINENEEMREKIRKSVAQTKDMLNYTGAVDDVIDECLESLNEDYKKYREIGKQLNITVDKELKKEYGFTLNEFFGNLYDFTE